MRSFLIIWLGQVISIVGSSLTSFGLAVWIFDQTGQATPFALTVLFGSLPRVLLAPFAGVAADRWNRRRIMILSDTGAAVVTLGALLLLTRGDLAVWHIYAIATVGSILGAFQDPAYSASVIMLVPKEQLGRANGLLQMGEALSMLIAPLLAGALFGLIGLRGIVFIDLATFFFAVGALLLVAIPQPKTRPEHNATNTVETRWSQLTFGWHYLRARQGLFGLLLFFALVNFLLNFAVVLLGPLVLSFSNATGYGIVQSVGGVGMLVGSIAMSAWGGPQRRMPAVISFIFMAACGLLAASLVPSVAVIAAGFFLLLFSVPFGSGTSAAIFQVKIDPDVQGRVFSMRTMISRSMMPLAFLLAGPLADRVFEPLMQSDGALGRSLAGSLLGSGPGRGIGLLFALAGLILMICTLLVWANPRIRNLEDELPDAVVSADPSAAAPVGGA